MLGLPRRSVCRGVARRRWDIAFAESLSAYPTSSDFVAAVPIAFARKHKVLGVAPADAAERIPSCSWRWAILGNGSSCR